MLYNYMINNIYQIRDREMQKLKKEQKLKEVLEKSRNKKVPELREQEVLKIHCLEEEVLFLVLDLEIMNLNSTKMLKN